MMKDEVLAWRKKHAISQNAMAKLCGISPTTLMRIEAGHEPSVIVRGKIEKVLELSWKGVK